MIWIQRQALENIKGACREHPTEETGGIVVGFSRLPLIIGSIPSTDAADRSVASYFQNEQDVNHLNKSLRQLQSKGFDFKGYYHKHPGSYDVLSGLDLDTARETLKDNFSSTRGEMLMILVNESSHYYLQYKNINTIQGEFLIKFYLVTISSPDSEEVECKEVKYRILPDLESGVFSLLKHANKTISKSELNEENQPLSLWDKDWHFSESSYGKERIIMDTEQIKARGYEVDFKIMDKNTACYEIRAGSEKKIVMLLPREYPITPPRIVILMKNGKRAEITNIEILKRWSSLFSPDDLLEEIEKRSLSGKLRKTFLKYSHMQTCNKPSFVKLKAGKSLHKCKE